LTDHPRPLAPVFVGRGTVTSLRDMLRALESLETLDYRYVISGEEMTQGRATLVKLLADPDSATMAVNGCLFLNVSSFRYLDFEQIDDGRWSFVLHGDGTILELVSVPESDEERAAQQQLHLLLDEPGDTYESILSLDEDDDFEE